MSNTQTWLVSYSNHDTGAQSGHMLKQTEARAKRTARLMRECGYRTTEVRQLTK